MKYGKIIIGIAFIALILVSDGNAQRKAQLITTETVKIDSTTKQIKMVSPDQMQQIEDKRGEDMKQVYNEIDGLKRRIKYLEDQINQ